MKVKVKSDIGRHAVDDERQQETWISFYVLASLKLLATFDRPPGFASKHARNYGRSETAKRNSPRVIEPTQAVVECVPCNRLGINVHGTTSLRTASELLR